MTALKPLSALKARDSRYCGVKAANLGALSALPPATRVPDGFCAPFSQYEAFMRRLQVAQKIAALEQRHDFQTDANARREAWRRWAEIAGAEPDAALAQSWLAQWNSQLKGQGVFVRSSSNSEDLPGFSGAGLYTTVPNVTQAERWRARCRPCGPRSTTSRPMAPRGRAGPGRRGDGGAGAAGGAIGQLGRDDHARSLRRRPAARDLHLGQARPGHQGGGRQAPGRAGDVFELVQGGAGAEPLGRGHAGARRRRRRARGAAARLAPGTDGCLDRAARYRGPPGQAGAGRRGPGHRMGRASRPSAAWASRWWKASARPSR